MNSKQIAALSLIRSCPTGRGLTHLGNTIVSRQAAGLLSAGLIRYGRGNVAYELTPAAHKALADHFAGLARKPIREDADATDLAQLKLYGSLETAAAEGMYGLVNRLTTDVPL